jgi:hypothetical protein
MSTRRKSQSSTETPERRVKGKNTFSPDPSRIRPKQFQRLAWLREGWND